MSVHTSSRMLDIRYPLPGAPARAIGSTHVRYRQAPLNTWNRELLSPIEFDRLDALYCDVYRDTRQLPEPDTACISALADRVLNQPTRAQAVTALRAMQAALFRVGILWRLPLSSLDEWRESSDSRKPTPQDYRRLVQLHDPQRAAIADIAALTVAPDMMRRLRLPDGHLCAPGRDPLPVPEYALLPLLVAAGDEQRETRHQRHTGHSRGKQRAHPTVRIPAPC